MASNGYASTVLAVCLELCQLQGAAGHSEHRSVLTCMLSSAMQCPNSLAACPLPPSGSLPPFPRLQHCHLPPQQPYAA